MTPNRVLTHYDLTDIRYSSFYSTGFELNAQAYGYEYRVTRRRPPFVAASPSSAEEWHAGMSVPSRLLFRLNVGGDGSADRHFCIDTSDHDLNYHVPLLREVDHYFKVNYDPECITPDSPVAAYRHKIHPILPFFPLRGTRQSRRTPRIVPSKRLAWDRHSMLRRVIDAPRILSIEEVRSMRCQPRRRDVVFIVTYYPGEHHAEAMELRYRIMEELERRDLHEALFGFASRTPLPAPYDRYTLPRLSLYDYMSTLGEAQVAIYVRGLWDCISFKFGQQMALGLPVVGQTLSGNRAVLNSLPHFRTQFAYDEPTEIVDRTVELVGRPAEARVLSESNARLFDTVLHPRAVTAEVLYHYGITPLAPDA